MENDGAPRFRHAPAAFLGLAALMVAAAVLASLVQSDFGRLEVTNVSFRNEAGRLVRAKLLRPSARAAGAGAVFPGAVYIHGYQNNRETSDPYCIELARRGFAVLEIDALGRGNSDPPGDPDESGFDPSYGGKAAVAYLRGLDFVDPGRVGVMGHSLGAEMAYGLAMEDPTIRAISFSGFGFTDKATRDLPRNALMIFGKYDEYRARMTGTKDFEAEYLSSPRALAAIPSDSPRFGVTYGDFAAGSARRVYMPRTCHVLESHDRGSVAEAVSWMREALGPDPALWIESGRQVWELKEWATLVAMLACLASLLPLAQILLSAGPFAAAAGRPSPARTATPRERRRLLALNFALSWLYLPLVLCLFGLHLYVVRIDRAFPLMMSNGLVFWFLVAGAVGIISCRRGIKKGALGDDFGYREAGLAPAGGRRALAASAGLAAALFLWALGAEWLLERLFVVDFRFVFPFASDLTPSRAPLVLLYLPFLFVGFLGNGLLVHVRLARPRGGSAWRAYLGSWLSGWAVLALPLLTIIAVQYLPILAGGNPPFVGPGASLVGFVLALFPVLLKLLAATALSQFLYERTGNLYAGALVSAALVAWMFASSQVIAPIPI